MSHPAVFDHKKSIYSEYFRLSSHYIEKCGPNTVLLMQVGAFFEIYATKTPAGTITRTRIEDVCRICGGLSIAEKKYMHGADMIVMAGFRDYNLERYIQTIVDADFTVVIYTQKELEGGEFTREHTGTYSPGTYMPNDADVLTQMTNNIVSIWIDQYTHLSSRKTHIVVGASVVNIFTGESALFEFENAYEMVPATFDALEKFISTHSPSETIFITPYDDAINAKIAQYTGIQSRVTHFLQNTPENGTQAILNCRQPKYVRQILSTFFKEDTYDVCQEFQRYVVATQAYTYLLHFIQERNPNLVRKIVLPLFDNQSTTMVLANHTLRQLNIIEDGALSSSQQLRSVSSFLNKCCSAGGKRRFYNQIVHPVFDVDWLNREYEAIAQMLDKYEMVGAFRRLIGEIVDLEKIARQLITRKLYPDAVARLYKSIIAIQQIHVCLLEDTQLTCYFINQEEQDPHEIVSRWITDIMRTISDNLLVDKCVGVTSNSNFDCNIIQPGVSAELDDLISRRDENELLFLEIRERFNQIMCNIENKKTGDYVKVHDTEKSGSFLQLTKKRSSTIKAYFSEQLKRDPNAKIMLSHKGMNIPVLMNDIHMTSSGTSTDNIEFPMLDRIIRERLSIRDTLNQCILQAYSQFLDRMETDVYETIERLAEFVSRVDVLQSKAYVARIYGYCRPEIVGGDSYVSATGLRHCLIEQIQTNELYVANDVEISGDSAKTSHSGILLYGTNAVGKTSLIRAVGIAVILAQTGMYVPCRKFVYSPYRSIFTRILGNDNLFKGLSMFAVEMSELRVILNSADQYSLVLGDELCSGTETESALSIFMSGLMDLHKKRASFLFATHFHEILKFEEMKRLMRVAVKHMAVRYDMEMDCLIYDRLLREGAGNRLYGLEVAKSLHLPDAFIETAYQIRNTYFPEMQGELSASVTRYNAKKVRSMCEMCKTELATETHHLIEQKRADKTTGFIEEVGIQKNHAANLAGLCEKCHLKMHHMSETSTPVIVRKKTTKGYVLAKK